VCREGRLVSNGNWNLTSFVAAYLECPYYGYTIGSIDKVDSELKQYGADYFLAWQPVSPPLQTYLLRYSMKVASEPNLEVFKLSGYEIRNN
jgi:hypothetical protein